MSTLFNVSGSELDNVAYVQEVLQSTNYFLSNEEYEKQKQSLKYPEFYHRVDPKEIGSYRQIENADFAKKDKGHLGDREFKNLFPEGSKVDKFDLSPNLGTEVDGIQLSELDDAGKNDLALFLETRGLGVFRNQDLRDKGPGFATEFARHFGPLHIHPVASTAKGYPEILSTLRPAGGASRYDKVFGTATHSYGWHSDVSFEQYPASFSFFVALEAPPSGGDTVFIDLREAYNRLSEPLKRFFETLTVVHSNHYQRKLGELKNQNLRAASVTTNEHPLVRTHPVTKEKSLFYSRGFIQRIKGLKPTESGAILNFLEGHVLHNPELQVRATHRGTDSGTVIAWDNRFLLHTATVDFLQHETGPRHHFRLTVVGEKPFFEEEEEVTARPQAY